MLEIDGSHGEGGGQLVRTAVALAAVTRRSVRITHMRARRAKPGLAPQHLTAVRAVAVLCGATVDGLVPGSQEIAFVPGELRGGSFEFDVGTAGSVPLVLQALLPVMIASGRRVDATVTGGTDVWQAPPLDYLQHVLLPLVARLGVRVTLATARRGYYPRGGGQVTVSVAPAALAPHDFDAPGALRALRGIAHVSNLPAHIASRMRDAALARLARYAHPGIDTQVLSHSDAIGAGGGIVLWAETEATVLGAGRVARRGVPAETLGDQAGAELAADLDAGATLDVHATDQMLVYFALAGGGTFLTREITPHTATTQWLIAQLLPVTFSSSRQGELTRVAIARG